MPRYNVYVYEVRRVECVYEVEAHSPEEAREKAEAGDTVDEWHNPLNDEVASRQIVDDPQLLPDPCEKYLHAHCTKCGRVPHLVTAQAWGSAKATATYSVCCPTSRCSIVPSLSWVTGPDGELTKPRFHTAAEAWDAWDDIHYKED